VNAKPAVVDSGAANTQNPKPSDVQAQSQNVDTDNVGVPLSDPALAATSDRAGMKLPEPGGSSAPSGPTTSNAQAAAASKNDPSVIANFGFSALAAATSPANAAVSASSATSTAALVPVAGLAVAIAARAQAGSNQFDIRLDPPELGRIDVRLDVDRDGQVTTHVTADRADTLALLQNQQPQLEQALNQAGLKTADDGLQFSLRDQTLSGQNQSFTGQNNGSCSQAGANAQVVIPDADLTPSTATQIYARAGLGSGLDIRI
jgi:chemotaxis protein MotD